MVCEFETGIWPVLTAQSLEPDMDSVSPFHFLPLPTLYSLSLSKINKERKKTTLVILKSMSDNKNILLEPLWVQILPPLFFSCRFQSCYFKKIIEV